MTVIADWRMVAFEGLWLGDRLITLKLVMYVRRYKSGADEQERNMYREACFNLS